MSKALQETKAAKLAEVAIEEAKMNKRLADAEHEARVEAAIEEAKARSLEHAILKTRVWRSEVVAPGRKLSALLNDWEAMGWTLVNIMENGIGAVTVVSARTIEQPIEIPADLDEVEEKTGENAPEDVATQEGEQKRTEWAEKHAADPTPDASGAVEGEDHDA